MATKYPEEEIKSMLAPDSRDRRGASMNDARLAMCEEFVASKFPHPRQAEVLEPKPMNEDCDHEIEKRLRLRPMSAGAPKVNRRSSPETRRPVRDPVGPAEAA